MNFLKERILNDGKWVGTKIVKADSFLNHQVDVKLADHIGEAFAEYFKDSGVTKILTVEASGIPVAMSTARAMGCLPMVFAKKGAANTMSEGKYSAPLKSFTNGSLYGISVSKEFIKDTDKVLIVDDFLATGEACIALLDLCRQARAKCAGFGIVIEKQWQGGAKRLTDLGYTVKSLAVIKSAEDGKIVFAED